MISDISKRIFNEYEEERSRAAAIHEKKLEELYKKHPKLLEYKNILNRMGMENTKNILLNPQNADKIRSEFEKKLKKVNKEKEKYLSENGIESDYDKIKYNCERCSDTGYTEDGKKCICFKNKMIKYAYKCSNLSEVMSDMCFENFSLDYYSKDGAEDSEYENMKFILERAKSFCDNFPNKRNLFMCGNTGLGKTFLSVSIAKKILQKEKSVMYFTAQKLFSEYERYKFHDSENLEMFLDDVKNADLLIIDDLGTEFITKISVAFMFDLVNERVLTGKKIIINTNLSMNKTEELYSKRLTSRIYEYFDVFVFRGKDIRIQKQYLE